jgi:hypothetical protein
MRYRLAAIALLMVSLLACSQPGVPASSAKDAPKVTAFVGVSVVPGDRERVLLNQTVLVQGGRIGEMGPASTVKVPPAATRIEGKGKFLMPGIAEMHAHLPDPNLPEEISQFKLFVANGVTTVRGMLGTPNQLELRERIRSRVGAGVLSGWSRAQGRPAPALSCARDLEVQPASDVQADLVSAQGAVTRLEWVLGGEDGIRVDDHAAEVAVAEGIAQRESSGKDE